MIKTIKEKEKRKIIYLWCFFNDLFICIVAAAFSLFGTSKELIRDSQRLSFCNLIRLPEKAQDNTSNLVVVEKKRLILEKDNEEQSKYYPSYPKPPVLDMKW